MNYTLFDLIDEIERLRSENKAQLEELGRIDDALGTNEGPSAVDHILILKTENERLAAELANLQIAFNDWKVMHSTVRLELENERLRGDAERYQWLRENGDDPRVTEKDGYGGYCLRYGTWLDTAIDNVLKGTE